MGKIWNAAVGGLIMFRIAPMTMETMVVAYT